MKQPFEQVQDILARRQQKLRDVLETAQRYSLSDMLCDTLNAVVDEIEAISGEVTTLANMPPSKRPRTPAQQAARQVSFAKAIAVRRENIARKRAAAAQASAPAPATPPAPALASPTPVFTALAQTVSKVRVNGSMKSDLNREAEELFSSGATARDVADELGVKLSTVSVWLMQWRIEQKKAAAR